jgi:hypothetical protein
MKFDDDGEDLSQRIENYRHNVDRVMRTTGNIEKLDTSVADPSSHTTASRSGVVRTALRTLLSLTIRRRCPDSSSLTPNGPASGGLHVATSGCSPPGTAAGDGAGESSYGAAAAPGSTEAPHAGDVVHFVPVIV